MSIPYKPKKRQDLQQQSESLDEIAEMNMKKDNAHDKSSSSLSDCHVERDSEHESIRSGGRE